MTWPIEHRNTATAAREGEVPVVFVATAVTFGRVQERKRVKRLYFPADARDITLGRPGMHERRTGTRVHGVPIRYRTQLAAASAQRDQTRYRLPERWIRRVHIVDLPDRAKNVRLSDRAPAGPKMAVR